MRHPVKFLLTFLLLLALSVAVGFAENSVDEPSAQYQAYTNVLFCLRRTPDESNRGITIEKRSKVLILEWDDEWCKIQYEKTVGYAKPQWLCQLRSLDALHYPIPNLPHQISGYVEFSQETLIQAGSFKGFSTAAGQIACVEATDAHTFTLPVWRSETQLTDDVATYHPFVAWAEAESGDAIGGFTTFYGEQQGNGRAAAREYNIIEGCNRISGTTVESGAEFSFNNLCAPYRQANGYQLAPNISANGFGYGGGVCQVTTTLYNAAMTLPMQINEWALHSKSGVVYVPQYFDAAVGNYRDFRFTNLLPYAVRIEAIPQGGMLTVLFFRA